MYTDNTDWPVSLFRAASCAQDARPQTLSTNTITFRDH